MGGFWVVLNLPGFDVVEVLTLKHWEVRIEISLILLQGIERPNVFGMFDCGC